MGLFDDQESQWRLRGGHPRGYLSQLANAQAYQQQYQEAIRRSQFDAEPKRPDNYIDAEFEVVEVDGKKLIENKK